MKQPLKIIFILMAICCIHPAIAQIQGRPFRTFGVEDGLPQSYISSIIQDGEGFIWIGTRDGLAKYDGRKFKSFRYTHADKTSLSSNIISLMHLDSQDRLWIKHEQGDIDILDTRTGLLKHLYMNGGRSISNDMVKNRGSFTTDATGRTWILDNNNNGVYIIGKKGEKPVYYTRQSLMPQQKSKITGIAKSGRGVLVVTDKSLVLLNEDLKVAKSIPHAFPKPSLYNPNRPHKDNSPVVRENEDIIIPDEERLIIYSQKTEVFTVIPLPAQEMYLSPPRLLDERGNLYLAYNDNIYMLTQNNKLIRLPLEEHRQENLKITCMLLDRSGVLWLGTNGYGLLQYDMRLNRIPKYSYYQEFHEEMLKRLGVSNGQLKGSFIHEMKPYIFRWARGNDGRIWISKANADKVPRHNVAFYKDSKLVIPDWEYPEGEADNYGIYALSMGSNGKLWGIDHFMRPVCFNTNNYGVIIYDRIFDSKGKFNRAVDITGLVTDPDETFWLSSNFGLIKYSHGKSSYSIKLPGTIILSMAQSKTDKDILWIGTYSDGLIAYSKSTGNTKYFTIKNGLPNNTLYGILYDDTGNLWCSSNKGIFSFAPETSTVTAYTSKDGLPTDEFNRFNYFKFPNGQIGFGGTKGYTVFNPGQLSKDNYQPKIALTGIRINNEPANYGETGSLLTQDINSLAMLQLPHDKNFLSFEFAALEFNIPEKIKYRYMLDGLDSKWVYAGKDNTATYTTIPPGEYTLIVNATNTDGIWSKNTKKLVIIIAPPFWETWWFIALCFVIVATVVMLVILQRLKSMRMKDRQKMAFEKEIMELEAKALRSQMNPHFIFNSLNSINSMIKENHNNEATVYLNVFSKLIRNQLNNNVQEISLYDELDTCRLYLQLESMRFSDKLKYHFDVPERIDLYSIMVPPLLIQPFIENAIIHGILPLETTGNIVISVEKGTNSISCRIDDNGIGRKASQQYNMQRRRKHVSHGINLINNRIKLHNELSNYKIDTVIEDKRDNGGNPMGTCVILNFTNDD